MPNRRSRTVIFRLTDDEYDSLRNACQSKGARNVSDFARNALFESVARAKGQHLADKIDQIQTSVRRLESLVEKLTGSNGGAQ